jgi:hypothetical protein
MTKLEDGAPIIAAPHKRCASKALDPQLEDGAPIIAAPHRRPDTLNLRMKDGSNHPKR